MGKINGCLKCVFFLLNAMFGIFGGLMIFGLVKAQAVEPQLPSAVGPWLWAGLWVFSLGMLMVSILGETAATTEKTAMLKVFAGLVVAVMIIMMILGIVMASYRNKVKVSFENISPDIVGEMMAENNIREILNDAQGPLQCCGFMSYQDWGNSIPGSCKCSESTFCTNRPGNLDGPAIIYSRPCFPIASDLLDLALTVSMGVLFGFAVTALLCLKASLLMIRQVRRHNGGRGGQAIAMTAPGYKLTPGI
ncbi:23 kDa integral membrane protein isoform X1 [Gadus morhua]|uniref:Tetraspanin n=1 Tax=Gadus morhua TaxID=8049 RepID=A0A8C5BJR6_GADMO|nr:23 kDa integral membrane protein-like isoform X1 [Gadus morhua]